MIRTLSRGVLLAAAAGALVTAPIAAANAAPAADHATVTHQQPPGWGGDPGWGGWNRPGWHDPHDRWHNDWRCDRHGWWHNDHHDRWGHRDHRCRPW